MCTYSDDDVELNEVVYRLPYDFPVSTSVEVGCTAVSGPGSVDVLFGNAAPLDALGRAQWFAVPQCRDRNGKSKSSQQQQQQPQAARQV